MFAAVMSPSPSPVRTGKIQPIEDARGIAAILVVLAHAAMFATWAARGKPPFGGFFVFGGNGIDFFFVLSGFIITKVYLKDVDRPKAIGHYVWRRFTRVVPPYWAATLLSIPLVTHWQAGYRADIKWSVDFVVRNALLLPVDGYPIVAPAWSLTHEMAYYALFGLAIINRRLGLFAFALWLMAIIAGSSGIAISAPLLQPPDAEFYLGMLVALLPIRAGSVLISIGMIAFMAEWVAEWLDVPQARDPIWSHVILGLSSASIVAGLSVARVTLGRVGAKLGAASYAIYLAHYPAIGALHLHHPSGPPELIFMIYAAVGIGAGLVFHSYVETPLLAGMRKSRKFLPLAPI